MIASIRVETFMLFTGSEKFIFLKILFLQKLFHGHGKDRYCVKRFAVSNFDFLYVIGKFIGNSMASR